MAKKGGRQAQSPSYSGFGGMGGGGGFKGASSQAQSPSYTNPGASSGGDPNFNNNQFAPSAPNMFAGGSSSYNEAAGGGTYTPPVAQTPAPQAPPQQAPSVGAPAARSAVPQTAMAKRAQAVENSVRPTSQVRADVYNTIHPYAKPLQGNAQGMATPPPSYQRPAWMDIEVKPGDKEAFARRRAAQIAETNANRTIVQGQNGMKVSYGPGYVNDKGMGAYMNDTLHGRAPSGGTSVPGSDMRFKGR